MVISKWYGNVLNQKYNYHPNRSLPGRWGVQTSDVDIYNSLFTRCQSFINQRNPGTDTTVAMMANTARAKITVHFRGVCIIPR